MGISGAPAYPCGRLPRDVQQMPRFIIKYKIEGGLRSWKWKVEGGVEIDVAFEVEVDWWG